MTGHVLIVDALATNRIVLKATLSAAFYEVRQASNAQDVMTICKDDTPDLVIFGADLPDLTAAELVRRLDRVCTSPAPPVMLLLPEDDAKARLNALQSGVSDVMAHPLDEDELFARLRALLRQRRLDSDLVMHVNTASALGFSEDPVGFTGPERATVLSGDCDVAKDICARISPYCRYDLMPACYKQAGAVMNGPARPDIALLHIAEGDLQAGMRSLAVLQASAIGRDLRLIALSDAHPPGQAAKLLDMGACDVVELQNIDALHDRELAFRMTLQMARKKRSDTLRGQLENGLQAAVLDPLTGLHNRRYAQMFLRRMIEDAEHENQSFAVMIADLDHFKSVNDTHGHAAGDRVLMRTAAVMRDALPSDTMIARVGGEEFLIAVPDTNLSDVRSLAGRVGRAVRETPVMLSDRETPVHVTVSIGATLVHPSGPHAMNADALIEQADKALYDSKSGGRDTVTVTLPSAA